MHNMILQNILSNIWNCDLYPNTKIKIEYNGIQYFIKDSDTDVIIEAFETIGDFYITETEIKFNYSDYTHSAHYLVLTSVS